MKDIQPGAAGANIGGFTAIGDGRILFDAGDKIRVTDGTEAGTQLVATPNTGTEIYYTAPPFTAIGGGTFLFADGDQDHGRELWQTDGTEAGNVLRIQISNRDRNRVHSFISLRGGGSRPLDGYQIIAGDPAEHRTRSWKRPACSYP